MCDVWQKWHDTVQMLCSESFSFNFLLQYLKFSDYQVVSVKNTKPFHIQYSKITRRRFGEDGCVSLCLCLCMLCCVHSSCENETGKIVLNFVPEEMHSAELRKYLNPDCWTAILNSQARSNVRNSIHFTRILNVRESAGYVRPVTRFPLFLSRNKNYLTEK